MKLSLEKWWSSDNRHERHYFIKEGEGVSYQDGRYVFGYNPEIISPEKVHRILEIINE